MQDLIQTLPPWVIEPPLTASAFERPLDFYLGTVLREPHSFILPEEMLATHMTVLGRTGSGKSKLIELWLRQMIVGGRGCTLIDPNGDLSEDILAFVAYLKASGDDTIWRKVHYIEPSYEMVFGYDPFRFRPSKPIEPQYSEMAYRAWLHTKVDRVSEILQRKQGQAGFEGMPRLQRVLTDVLLAVGTTIDDSGRHLPLADSLVLFDITHPRHQQVFDLVSPHLDAEIRGEFNRFRVMNVDRRMVETESTINRLRSFLSPLVKSIFADHVHQLDFRRINQNGEVLLVNLRETDYFSADTAKAIGGLFIHEVLTGAASTPRELRVPHTLIIDEAPDFIGADIDRALRQCRKYLLTVCLAGQNVTSFQKGDLDLVDVIISQPGVLMSFEQRLEADLEILAPAIFRGNFDCETELFQVMDRPDGQDFLEMTEYATNFTQAVNWSDTIARSKTHTTNYSQSKTKTEAENWAEHTAHSQGKSRAASQAHSVATAKATSAGQSPIIQNAKLEEMLSTHGSSATHTNGTQAGTTDTTNAADTVGNARGGGLSHSVANARGGADAQGRTDSHADGGSEGTGFSISYKTVLVPRTREEWHPTGRLRHAIADQLEFFKCSLHALRGREAAVKLPGVREGFFVRIADVTEKWSRRDKFVVIDRMKRRLFDLHPYNIRPEAGNEAQDRRLVRFLGLASPDGGANAQGFNLPNAEYEDDGEINPIG